MRQYYQFLPKDGKLLPCVFKVLVRGALTDRPLYGRYQCRRCGRIDAGPALASSGLDPAYEATTGSRHLSATFDYMCVVNADLKSVLESACDDICYYDIQNKGDAFVIWPKHIITPDDSGAFTRTERCDLCNVYRATVFGPEPLTAIPDVTAGAVMLEGPQGPMPAWFVNSDLAKTLRSIKPKGLTLTKWHEV